MAIVGKTGDTNTNMRPKAAPAAIASTIGLMLMFHICSVASCNDGQGPAAPARVFSVKDFGAAGDGKTLDTAAINKAIAACAAAGGGQVVLPAGKYLSGTVHLKSNVSLQLAEGARLIGTDDLEAYQHFQPPPQMPEAKWTRWHRALLLADGAENVTITGPGTIDGNKVFDPKGEERMRGPHTILLGNCRKVTIEDLLIVDSANYAILFECTDDVVIRRVNIAGGWDGVHFRGWQQRPCRNVTIADCQMATGDDCIAGRYWENVTIVNCSLNSSCNCVRLIGPATKLLIDNCRLWGPGLHPHRTSKRQNTLAGLNLQPGAWDRTEGHLDDVTLSNLTMENVATAFHFALKPGNTAGKITVSNVKATGVYRAASSVESWAKDAFGYVTFRNVTIEYQGGGTAEQARMPVKAPGTDARPLPAWGFYLRNVDTLRLENVHLECVKPDARPMLIAHTVQRLELDALKFPPPPAGSDLMVLEDVSQVELGEGQLRTVQPRVLQLRCQPEAPAATIQAGKPIVLVAEVQNGPVAGLAKLEAKIAERTKTFWVWLAAGQRREVVLAGLTAPAPGQHLAECAGATARITVHP